MATKHYIPLEDKIAHKKPKISEKLRPNAITTFLTRWHRFMLNSGQNNQAIRICQIRSILISQAYFNASLWKCEKNSYFSLRISSIGFRIGIFSNYDITFDWSDYKQIIALMRISKFTFLIVEFDPCGPNTPNCVSIFIRLCKAIKGLLFKYFLITIYFLDSPTLKKISIGIYYYDNVLVPILSDFLPDKIVGLEGCAQSLRNFRSRKCIMKSVLILGGSNLHKTGK